MSFRKQNQEDWKPFGGPFAAQHLKMGDMDKLISFHAYGPKFTGFKKLPRTAGMGM